MTELFPSQNDYFVSDYQEELSELMDFGINSAEAFKQLMANHRPTLLQIDKEPLDDQLMKWYSEEKTFANLDEKTKNGYWFAFPALIRIALELEFGERYRNYGDRRDKIV